MKTLKLLLIITVIAFSTKAQDIAMHTPIAPNSFKIYNTPVVSKQPIVPLLTNDRYTYKYKNENVLVVFSGNEHIEYYNDKKHFIKSSIEWVSNDECYMTIKASNLPNFPFKKGTKLHMKINKIKRGYIYYQSTLGGRSWTGRMKKMN